MPHAERLTHPALKLPPEVVSHAPLPVTVRAAQDDDCAMWEQFVGAHGCFLQSWQWGALRSSQGWQALRLLATCEGAIVGVAQGLLRRFAPGVAMLYVPRGPVTTSDAAIAPLVSALRTLGKQHGACVLRMEPQWLADAVHIERCRALGMREAPTVTQLPHTVLVNINQAQDAVLASFRPTWRRYIRHAPKRGVAVREGTAADLATFYALERETAMRQRTLGRPLAYYQAFWQRFQMSGAHLFLAELAGDTLGAIITLEHGTHATYLYGGSTRRRQDVHANYLLQWTAMCHAQRSGCTSYDLWGCGPPDDPASPEAGLTAFKRGFGPVVAWVGAWDLPLSPPYAAWRQVESARKRAVRWRAQRALVNKEDGRMAAGSPFIVRDATAAPARQWDAWLAASPGGGHWMQTHAWGEFKRRQGRESVRLVLEEHGTVVGSAEVVLYALPLIGTLAYCAKGPWLDWANAAQVAAFFKGARAVLMRKRAFAFQIEPEALEADERLKEQLSAAGFRRYWTNHQFKTTMVVDLQPGEAALQAAMSQTGRRYIRAAQRAGVTVHEDASPGAREVFHAMFMATSQRDGFFMRPRAYLMAGWKALLDAEMGRFLLAYQDGQPVAGMFLTSFNGKVWYKDGASSPEGQKLHAPYLLQWEAMRWGKAHGASYYDMVAIPDPDQLENREHPMWGLYDFKRKFGGEVREFVRAYKQPYMPRVAALWDRLEPLYYRVYMRLKKDVYY